MFNKRVLKKAVDELNKAKKPAKQKDIIVDPKGQWAHPGQVTRIPSNKITMQGVGYPVLGVPNKGQPKMMMPGQYFEFPEADYVDEYPQMQDGGQIYTYAKRPGSYYKKDSKGNWMIKNESTHGKYVAIDDPKGTRTKVLNAQAKPMQSAPKVEETLVTQVKPRPQDNSIYDSTVQSGESTAVRNIIQKPIPDVIGKDTLTYLKEQQQKKEKAINKNIRAKNEKVQQFYKEYHESPRYIEMLSKSSPDKYEDYAAGRMINLEGLEGYEPAPHLHIRHKQPKNMSNTGGYSRSSTGDVTILPLGFSGKGMLPHEWSHSSDRPIFLGINPFTGENFKIRSTDRLIPKKDEQWITKNKPKTWFDSPEFKSMDPDSKKIYRQYPEIISDQEEFMNYVGEPTETRARLNDIRFQSKQRGIYDPFTEKVTPAILKKLLKTKFESEGAEGFDALQQLKGVYTDEQIQWMLNNISKNKQAEEEGAQSFGRYGGQFAKGGSKGCPPGTYWNGKSCVKSFVPVAKQTPKAKSSTKNKKEQELINYGKKTLPNKKITNKPIDNIPYYGDLSNAAQPDDLTENIIEFADWTGHFSWDDAYRAKAAWDKSGSEYPSANQVLDMFGAVPGLGKLGKLKYLKNANAIKNSMKYVAPAFGIIPWQQIVNAVDTGQDINQDNIKFQDGGEQGCPEGYAFNPKTGECVEWNPDIRESYDQPTSFDSIGDVIYINPDDRPEGMSDQEYQDMYNDQIEHEQLHRLQWINDELKGQNQTPLRMPSTVDNPEYGGDHYYNRRQEEEAYLHDIWNQRNPELARFIPEDVIYNNETDPVMYELPWTVEGEARGYEGALHRGMESFFPKKQDGGVPQYAPGGSAGCPPGYYYNGKDCVKLPKGAKVITDPEEYKYRKAAYDDSLWAHNTFKEPIDKPGLLTYTNPITRKPVDKLKPVKSKHFSSNDPYYRAYSDAVYQTKRSPYRTKYRQETGKDLPRNWSYKADVREDFYPAHSAFGKGFTYPFENYIATYKWKERYKKPKQPVVFAKEYPKDEEIVDKRTKPKPKPVTKKEEHIVKKEEPLKENIVKENVVIDKLPIKPAYIDQPKRELVTQTETTPIETEPEYSPEYSEEGGPDSIGYHYKDRQKRYIDWNGRAVGYRPLKFRKPGHSGDLIKLGSKKYFYLPTIESRTEDWFEADNDNEEEYQHGGSINYELGDEVDEATMKRLKKLGYTFEKI
jgi:hypothetical protein